MSVFGDSFDEAAEFRRRWRLAVISALGFHQYYPEETDRIGYFNIKLPESDSNSLDLAVPFEWYELADINKSDTKTPTGRSSYVLVLWLNETRFTTNPLKKLETLYQTLSSTDPKKKGSQSQCQADRAGRIGDAGESC